MDSLIKQLQALMAALQAYLTTPPKPPTVTIQDLPKPAPSSFINGYLWDNALNSRHSVRVICDEMNLRLDEKNLITACIRQESNFNNGAIGRNKDASGKVLSTDWGLCQINDFYQIGQGKYWSSVTQVVNNPDKAVKWMISMYKQGHLNLWVSYSSGAYKQWL